ncbi:MAG: RIO1 family regulatory kinase/ATPase [Planctomycetota bacterium]|nr:RIO1 family regulatory kinase/ATPase [Planctomycetota bacterium]MDI6787521.1 RIO1 family regulatory kinase/ATPase [Planctomycetota bacterium]
MDYQLLDVIKDKSLLTPVVKLIVYRGEKVIWKDYSSRPWWVKRSLGDILINNEGSILKRLSGIKGIPRLIGRTPDGLLIEYIEGRFLHKFKDGEVPYEIIKRLESVVSEVHACSVVHLDLAQRKNILITEDFHPYLVDFSNALYSRPNALFFSKMFDYLLLIDKGSILKFKNRYFSDKMTEGEKRYLRMFWFIRRFWIFSPKTFRAKDRV